MNPAYFRMLYHSSPSSTQSSRPHSPPRTLGHSDSDSADTTLHPPPGIEFIGSEPSPSAPHGISSSAFSPNYFKKFFVEEKELGRGGKGVVLLVRHELDGVYLGHFACKRVPVGDDHGWLEKVLVEVQLLQNLSHQNLVSYRHVWLEDYKITNFGPSVPCAFILQQYCNAGDLQRYVLEPAKQTITKEQMKERMRRKSKGQLEPPTDLHSHKRMQFEEIFSFFRDITSGLHHLHSHGYIHRDLKPSNCLLHSDSSGKLRVLVSDFGEVQMENMTRKSTGATGTIAYCAPEVLRRDLPTGLYGNFSTKSDVFSLGMIVYFMCFGKLPYSSADDINEEKEDLDQLREEISAWAGVDEEWKFRTNLPDKLYHALKSLLAINPNDRPSTDEILRAIINNRNTSVTEDLDHVPRPNILDDFHRISNADSPSPTPRRQPTSKNLAKVPFPHKFAPPGPSHLRHVSPDRPLPAGPPKSPTRETEYTADVSETAALIRPRRTTPEHIDASSLSPKPPSPSRQPLALPPPPPPQFSRLHRLYTNPITRGSLKILVFLLKYVFLTRPCAPYAASIWLSFPLILVASLDFLYSSASISLNIQKSLVLLALHFFVLGLAFRYGVLCQGKVMV
jgi:serine/threonine protein kinase